VRRGSLRQTGGRGPPPGGLVLGQHAEPVMDGLTGKVVPPAVGLEERAGLPLGAYPSRSRTWSSSCSDISEAKQDRTDHEGSCCPCREDAEPGPRADRQALQVRGGLNREPGSHGTDLFEMGVPAGSVTTWARSGNR
jgi:hypothetical protein